MRYILALFLLLLAATVQASPVPGGDGQPHPTLKPVDMKLFCGSTSCSASAGDETTESETGKMRFLNKKAIVLKTNAQKHPVADWGPSASYQVKRQGQEWGACTEYPRTGESHHENAVILLPWENHNSVPDAHRFVGDALSCKDIIEGERTGELILPVVERGDNAEAAPRFVLWHCRVSGCSEEAEARSVRVARSRARPPHQSGT
jgi:hypothetical protein